MYIFNSEAHVNSLQQHFRGSTDTLDILLDSTSSRRGAFWAKEIAGTQVFRDEWILEFEVLLEANVAGGEERKVGVV